jgi:hypothetical protein
MLIFMFVFLLSAYYILVLFASVLCFTLSLSLVPQSLEIEDSTKSNFAERLTSALFNTPLSAFSEPSPL